MAHIHLCLPHTEMLEHNEFFDFNCYTHMCSVVPQMNVLVKAIWN